MLHKLDDTSPFEQRLQVAELEHVTTSRAAAIALAENSTWAAWRLQHRDDPRFVFHRRNNLRPPTRRNVIVTSLSPTRRSPISRSR